MENTPIIANNAEFVMNSRLSRNLFLSLINVIKILDTKLPKNKNRCRNTIISSINTMFSNQYSREKNFFIRANKEVQ